MMQAWSIKAKLNVLSISLLGLLGIVGGVEFLGSTKLVKTLNNLGSVQLPAVRNMTLADMMHDGLRAVVYRALIAADGATEEERKEISEESKEMSENFNTYISAIDALEIQESTRIAIHETKPAMEDYLKISQEIVALSQNGEKKLILEKLPEFRASFTLLEGKMEDLGELIEKDAEATKKSGEELASTFKIISLILIGSGLLIGILASVATIRNLSKTLSDVIDRLVHSSSEIMIASQQGINSASQLSESTTAQASSVQETMASTEEISAMVSQNAESANKVMDAVQTNQKVSAEGSKSVEEVSTSIEDIKKTNEEILSQMESSNKEFAQIVKIISEIGDKTKVINDIVFQTRLLSFNASVEAARAGEHGKGFAVVAEEVGNLAQMSGKAAKEITDLLSSSVKKVNDIVETTSRRVDHLIEIGQDKISVGQSTARKCSQALEKITENAKTVCSMITEITEASKEQAQGVLEINKAITLLDQSTQQNSMVAKESSSQAEKLEIDTKHLSESVAMLVTLLNGAKAKNQPSASIPTNLHKELLKKAA
jgi:methyl-accepting chemotaxis protein